MPKSNTVFEQRWSLWIWIVSVITLIVSSGFALWIHLNRGVIDQLQERTRNSLLSDYNNISHGIWITLLLVLSALIIRSISRTICTDVKPTSQQHWFAEVTNTIRKHPVTTIVLTAYVIIMVQESSWFYKEILTWYDDIFSDHLLNNFSFRHSFTKETMGRNDFRFFPLSHQDLHLLSWFTPYVKAWSLVSALELITTIVLSCKIVRSLNKNKSSDSLLLMGTLLFLFTSASAYNYFQFIYSERFLTFLLALYCYQYCIYQNSGSQRNGRLALLFALFIPFFKDTAIILAVLPAATTIMLGSIGIMKTYPSWNTLKLSEWINAYAVELAICSLAPFFLASYVVLSGLPSLFEGVQRYDSHLGFSTLGLDIRLLFLIGYTTIRLWLIARHNREANLLDSLNIAAVFYGLSLYALVGLEGANYMTLPIQFVAVMDILITWEALAAPWLRKRISIRQTQAAALGATCLILTIEDRQAATFRQRAELISWKQQSWSRTLDTADALAKRAKRKGDEVNLIFSKGWFKSSDAMKRLPYDRLIYYDIDLKTYNIKEGINSGNPYKPQKGDFLIDIDTGVKLREFGIDLSHYKLLYQENPDREYARIFRHR